MYSPTPHDPYDLKDAKWNNVEEWYHYLKKGGLRTYDNRWSNNKTYLHFVYKSPLSDTFHVALIDALGRIFLSPEWNYGGSVGILTDSCSGPVSIRDKKDSCSIQELDRIFGEILNGVDGIGLDSILLDPFLKMDDSRGLSRKLLITDEEYLIWQETFNEMVGIESGHQLCCTTARKKLKANEAHRLSFELSKM